MWFTDESYKVESNEALFHALQKNILRQVNTDEHHFADTRLPGGPVRSHVTAHQLVNALENHFPIRAIHEQNPFVAQHARAINIDNGAQKIFQLGRIKSAL